MTLKSRAGLSVISSSRIMGQASIDSVLEYGGAAHPALTTQLLATFGMLILSVGALVSGPLLPIPLYTCLGALSVTDFPLSGSCLDYKLLPTSSPNHTLHLWQCSNHEGALVSILTVMPALMVTVRVLFSLVAGLCFDVYGRRRTCVVAMGTYFIFSFSRTFAPTVEVSMIAILMEGTAVQVSTLALILIAVENSTQKECLRSACLILLGHSLSVAAGIPTIDIFLENHLWVQLCKALPAVAFIMLLLWMPESVRWVLLKGDWVDTSFLLPRTHSITLDEGIKPKLIAVQQQCEGSLAAAGCRGSSIRQSICPLFRSLPLFRVLVIGILCSAAYGYIAGARLVLDPSPYTSIADRSLAFGLTEVAVLLFVGLVLGRVSARPLVSITLLGMAATVIITSIFSIAGWSSCSGEVFVSLLGHAATVSAGLSLVVSLCRLCPTHSRGILLGLCWALASLGFSSAEPLLQLMDESSPEMARYSAKVYITGGVGVVAGLLALTLPLTPAVLPDTLDHIKPMKQRKRSNSLADNSELTLVENTKL